MSNIKRMLSSFVGVVILIVFVMLNQWVFSHWLKMNYFEWYLQGGVLIGIVTTAISMVWGDMRQHTGLIASNVWDYIGSSMQLVGLPVYVFGTHLRSADGNMKVHSVFDMLVGVMLIIILSIALFIWLIVVVPLQYFVFLISGAPGRLISHSQKQVIARLNHTQLKFKEIAPGDKVSEGWCNVSLSDKPVAITGLFSSLLFVIIQPLLGY